MRVVKLFVALLLLAQCSKANINNTENNKPNVILILADDLGINALNCFGNKVVESPNIDKLYNEGMHFTNGYANDPTCAPSRAAIMTGQYVPRTSIYRVIDRFKMMPNAKEMRQNMKYLPPENINLYKENSGLDPNKYNLAKLFKDNGYGTAAFGKWHLGKGTSGMHNSGFDEAIETHKHYNFGTYPKQNDYDSLVYNSDYCTAKGIDFMQRSVNESKPFFLYMPYYLVHKPFDPKEKYVNHFKKKLKGSEYDYKEVIDVLSMIKSLDDSVGELLGALKKLGQEKNTIVIFTSDNGHYGVEGNNMFALPFKGNKGQIWEGGIRVPYIFKWPDYIKENSESEEPIIHVDLYPTLADLLKLDVPEEYILDGKSIGSILIDDKKAIQDETPMVWCYTNYGGFNSETGKFKSSWKNVLQHNKLKLIEDVESGTFELYDLAKDPLETQSVFNKRKEDAQKLILKLENWKEETGLPEPKPNPEYIN